jgi:hypothetical protein
MAVECLRRPCHQSSDVHNGSGEHALSARDRGRPLTPGGKGVGAAAVLEHLAYSAATACSTGSFAARRAGRSPARTPAMAPTTSSTAS